MLATQPRVQKRPPRFYVPGKALLYSEPGATFQLGAEESHHALKSASSCLGDPNILQCLQPQLCLLMHGMLETNCQWLRAMQAPTTCINTQGLAAQGGRTP